jgi:putative zinc finger/helix-turn-helix YgiT family protein
MTCPRCGKALKRTIVKSHQYRESGLGNVYLQNIPAYQCECGERLMQIPAMDRLHDAIAYHLLKKPSLLTGEEFRFLRKWVELTANQLAALLGVKTRISVSRWENGKAPITVATDHAVRLLVMRLKEDALQQRMFAEIETQEHFERIAGKPGKPVRITISKEMLDRVPFPAQPVMAAR